jgi:hypothetical protein
MADGEEGGRDGFSGKSRLSIRTALFLIVSACHRDQKRPLLNNLHRRTWNRREMSLKLQPAKSFVGKLDWNVLMVACI